MSLAELQKKFQRFVLKSDKSLEAEVLNYRGSAKERMAIYADMYVLRLAEVLSLDFPILKKVMETAQFEKISQTYILQHTSKDFTLRYFSKDFPTLVSEEAGEALGALAQFEWTMGLAYDAPDASFLSLKKVQSLPQDVWPNLRFRFHPSVHILKTLWNVDEISVSYEDENEEIPSFKKNNADALQVFWRREHSVFHRVFKKNSEILMFESAFHGLNFTEICENLCDVLEEERVPSFAIEQLGIWLTEGFLSSVTY